MDLADQVFTTGQQTCVRDLVQKEVNRKFNEILGGDVKLNPVYWVPEEPIPVGKLSPLPLTVDDPPTTMQRWWRSSEYVSVAKRSNSDSPALDIVDERWMSVRSFRREIAKAENAAMIKGLEEALTMLRSNSLGVHSETFMFFQDCERRLEKMILGEKVRMPT